MKAAAIACWVAAWCCASVMTAAAWTAGRGRGGLPAIQVAAAAAVGAAGLAYAGAVLW